MFDFIKNVSPTELIIIAIVVLVLFGSKVMMKLARTSGHTVREMKKVKKEFTKAIEDDESSKS